LLEDALFTASVVLAANLRFLSAASLFFSLSLIAMISAVMSSDALALEDRSCLYRVSPGKVEVVVIVGDVIGEE
jgi:hypothetical protein